MPLRFRYFILLILWNFVFVCCCNSCSVFFLLTSCTGWCWWFDVGYTSNWWLTFIHGILCFKLFMQHIFINYLILMNSSKFKRCSIVLKQISRAPHWNAPLDCQVSIHRVSSIQKVCMDFAYTPDDNDKNMCKMSRVILNEVPITNLHKKFAFLPMSFSG